MFDRSIFRFDRIDLIRNIKNCDISIKIWVTLYNKVSFVNIIVNVLTNINEQ